MSKFLKISAVSAATLVALYAVGGYVVVPNIVKSTISEQSEKILGRSAEVGNVQFNPWTWTLEVSDVTVAGKTEPLLSLRHALVDVSSRSLSGAPIVQELRVDGLHVVASLQEKNVSKASAEAQASVASEKGKPLAFALHNVRVINSSVRVKDATRGIDQKISDINIALPFISTISDDAQVTMTPSLAMKINGTPVVAKGQASQDAAQLHLQVANLDVAQFTHLIPSIKSMGYQVDKARLTTDLKLYFKSPANGKSAQMTLAGRVNVADLAASERVGQAWQPLVSAHDVSVDLKHVNITESAADISSVSVLNPTVYIRRTQANQANAGTQGKTSAATSPSEAGAFDWRLARFSLQNGTVHWIDSSVSPQAQLKARAVNVSAQDVAAFGKKPARVSASAKIANGSVNVNGTVDIASPGVNCQLNLQNLSLASLNAPMQSYTGGIGADDGVLNAQGALTFDRGIGSWQGQVALKNLDLTKKGAKFVHWENASLMGMSVKTTDPLTLKIAELNVVQPGTVQTQAVKQVSQWVGALAALSGHDRTAERMQKVDEKLSKNIVIRDVIYENGRLSAQGVTRESVAGAVLDKIAQAFGAQNEVSGTDQR